MEKSWYFIGVYIINAFKFWCFLSKKVIESKLQCQGNASLVVFVLSPVFLYPGATSLSGRCGGIFFFFVTEVFDKQTQVMAMSTDVSMTPCRPFEILVSAIKRVVFNIENSVRSVSQCNYPLNLACTNLKMSAWNVRNVIQHRYRLFSFKIFLNLAYPIYPFLLFLSNLSTIPLV